MTEQLPPEAEQIGSLVFVPNQEYPYPFKVDLAPRFWMEEQTGALADAVDTYMNGERLSPAQLDLVKLYLQQYIERAVMAGAAPRSRLLDRIPKIRTNHDIENFADDVSEFGAEVF